MGSLRRITEKNMSTLEKINLLLEKVPEETLAKVYKSVLIIIGSEEKNNAAPSEGGVNDERENLLEELEAIRKRNKELYPEDYDWKKGVLQSIEEKYGRAD